jgi:toxin ParE1/3/4
MPKVRINAAAALELQEAALWYEQEAPGTGERLIDEFEAAIAILRDSPIPLVVVPGGPGKLGAKRLVLNRFPFDIVIIDHEDDELVVIAVAHQARSPGYWAGRRGT